MIYGKDINYILDNVDLTSLKDARIFITGNSGWYGRWLCAALSTAGIEHDTMSRTSGTFIGDVKTFQHPTGEYSDIIHLATESDIGHLLEFARICKCRRFLFASSGAVYGTSPPLCVKEEHQAFPNTTYGSQKYHAERLLADFAESYHFDYKILRCFSFLGAYMPERSFTVSKYIHSVIENEPITFYDVGFVRSYMYMADLCVWLLNILVKGHGTYNVGSDKAIELAYLAKKMAAMYKVPYVEDAPPEKIIGTKIYVPCTDKAKKLGLKDGIGLEEALERTVDSMR